MIVTEQLTIGNRTFVKTTSDSGVYIERDGVCYSTAFDPADTHRTYIETEEQIRYEPEDDDMFEQDQDGPLY